MAAVRFTLSSAVSRTGTWDGDGDGMGGDEKPKQKQTKLAVNESGTTNQMAEKEKRRHTLSRASPMESFAMLMVIHFARQQRSDG